MKRNLVLLNLMALILFFWGCKKEITQDKIGNIETKTTTIENAANKTVVDKSSIEDVIIEVKNDSEFNLELEESYEYDGKYYKTPNPEVVFYVWSSISKLNPNDVIFPNERIKFSNSKENGFDVKRWTIKPSSQHPYYRDFEEFKNDKSHYIVGFFYKNEEQKASYSTQFQKFKNELNIKPKQK